jgi:hypothetical protein
VKRILKLRTHAIAAFFILTLGASGLLADNLNWGGTYIADWSGFGTSPYTATDTSVTPNQGIQLFCLDFNDEIAPPQSWTASIMQLNSSNVASYAQYGGNYNNLVNALPGANPATDDVSTPYYAGANSTITAGPDSVNLSVSSADYTRYLEAAWLFTEIQSALGAGDGNTALIAQVAAWDLFVNAASQPLLQGDIAGTTGTYAFDDYQTWSGATYMNSGLNSTSSTGGLTFSEAVVVALAAAQNAVVNLDWGPGSYDYGSWSLVTGTPAYTVGYGKPVQEFLSPNAVPDAGAPEPQGAVLLGTVIVILAIRRGWLSPTSLRKTLGFQSRA